MNWWLYLLLVNVYLTLSFGFYTFLLRRETFFNLNRVYLISATVLSFILPFTQATWVKSLFITQQLQQSIRHLDPLVIYSGKANAVAAVGHVSFSHVSMLVYLCGVVFFTCRFIYQLMVLNNMMASGESNSSYSFFNNIRVKDCDTEYNMIAAHEEAHARQWHSVDVVLMEVSMIVNWINPVVYMYRKAIKHIHEFIADRDVIQNGTNRADYAMLLLSQTFSASPHQLSSSFYNHSLLKQRIQMLQRDKSAQVKLLKYGLSAPLFLLMLILSSATIDTNTALSAIKKAQVFSGTVGPDNQSGEATDFDRAPRTINELSDQDRADLYAVIKQHETVTKADIPVKKINNIEPEETGIFTAVEQNAEFPGGIEGFYKYLGENIKYPKQAREEKIEGKVFVTYIVEKDGTISNIKILRGIGGGTDEETIRVLSGMPKWKPGMQNGHVVRQQYTVPVIFKLVDEDNQPQDLQASVN